LKPGTRFPEYSIGRVVVKQSERGTGLGIEMMEEAKRLYCKRVGRHKNQNQRAKLPAAVLRKPRFRNCDRNVSGRRNPAFWNVIPGERLDSNQMIFRLIFTRIFTVVIFLISIQQVGSANEKDSVVQHIFTLIYNQQFTGAEKALNLQSTQMEPFWFMF
jgi:hypothetical protein